MPKDYRSDWTTWIASLEKDDSFRKDFLKLLHTEVNRGFEVIVKSASEEIEKSLGPTVDTTVHNILIETLAKAVWSGYELYLISENIDPKKANLAARAETNALGDRWTEANAQDKSKKLLGRVDPIYSLILEKQTELFLHSVILKFPDLEKLPYAQVKRVDKMISWAMHNGFFIGMLESDLHTKERPDKHYDRKYT